MVTQMVKSSQLVNPAHALVDRSNHQSRLKINQPLVGLVFCQRPTQIYHKCHPKTKQKRVAFVGRTIPRRGRQAGKKRIKPDPVTILPHPELSTPTPCFYNSPPLYLWELVIDNWVGITKKRYDNYGSLQVGNWRGTIS